MFICNKIRQQIHWEIFWNHWLGPPVRQQRKCQCRHKEIKARNIRTDIKKFETKSPKCFDAAKQWITERKSFKNSLWQGPTWSDMYIPMTTANLKSDNKYLEANNITCHQNSCALYIILFEENWWNPPEDEGELGNPARCVGSMPPPTSPFTEEPPKPPRKFNKCS